MYAINDPFAMNSIMIFLCLVIYFLYLKFDTNSTGIWHQEKVRDLYISDSGDTHTLLKLRNIYVNWNQQKQPFIL